MAAFFAGSIAAAAGTRAAMIVGAIGAVTAALPIISWSLRGAPDQPSPYVAAEEDRRRNR